MSERPYMAAGCRGRSFLELDTLLIKRKPQINWLKERIALLPKEP